MSVARGRSQWTQCIEVTIIMQSSWAEVPMPSHDAHDPGLPTPPAVPADPALPALLYLDDLWIGQRFVSRSHTIDAAQIETFAREFDPQPFHLDAEAAKQSLFEGQVASGWHTAAISMRLLVDGGAPLAGGMIGAGGEIKWPKPTRPG